MYKIMWLLKRKPGTTHEHFRHHYETSHSVLGQKYFGHLILSYQRNYLTRTGNNFERGGPEGVEEIGFDAVSGGVPLRRERSPPSVSPADGIDGRALRPHAVPVLAAPSSYQFRPLSWYFWDRHWTWHWAQRGIWYASHEWFYLARLPVEGGDLGHPERIRLTDEEVLVLRDWRWWSLDELRAERNRASEAIGALKKAGKSLAEVQAAQPAKGYTRQFGRDTGPWTTAMFVEAIYKTLPESRQ